MNNKFFYILFVCIFFSIIVISCRDNNPQQQVENIFYGTSWKGKVFDGMNKRYIYDIYLYFDNEGKSDYILYDSEDKDYETDKRRGLTYKCSKNTIRWNKESGEELNNFLSISFWHIEEKDNKMILIRDKSSINQNIIELYKVN